MRIHWIEHVEYEDLGAIAGWARERGHEVTRTVAQSEEYPDHSAYEMLVVMGGPMNVYEEGAHPWLAAEKRFIAQSIDVGRTVLGICLGSQLLATVLGAEVVRNPEPEVGWFTVRLSSEALHSRAFHDLPHEFVAGHWHGDTFAIPPGCRLLAESDACAHQAFEFDFGRVVGLQCHLEWTPDSIKALIEHFGGTLADGGAWVQSAEDIREGYAKNGTAAHAVLFALLDSMVHA